MSQSIINNVSDTALWIAYYRAIETARKDALFRDPFAKQLAGKKGQQIAKHIARSRYVSWSVVIRTCIIDSYIHNFIAQDKIDTILNIGAGLDTRPYRLKLPRELLWIEIDYVHMIEYKEKILKQEMPQCQLKRVKQDLTHFPNRLNFLSEINSQAKKALVLTEGVIPYLTNNQVASLADDLRIQDRFEFLILDYFNPHTMQYIRGPKMKKQMRNAPFLFSPDDWSSFFHQHGWKEQEIRYLVDESERLGRVFPLPWWARIFSRFFSADKLEAFRKFSGYAVLKPSTSLLEHW